MAISETERQQVLRQWFDGEFRNCLLNEDWVTENVTALLAAGIDKGHSPVDVVRHCIGWAVAAAIGLNEADLNFLKNARG